MISKRTIKYQRLLPRYLTILNQKRRSSNQKNDQDCMFPICALLSVMACGVTTGTECEKEKEFVLPKAPGVQMGMPIISRKEVAKHKTMVTISLLSVNIS